MSRANNNGCFSQWVDFPSELSGRLVGCPSLRDVFVIFETKASWKQHCRCKRGSTIFPMKKKTLEITPVIHFSGHWMELLGSADILCESHNTIHFQHLRCVLCTHRHHTTPLGAADRFVWPGSLFCLPSFSPSLSLSLLLHPYPLTPPSVPKPDIKKGLLKTTWVISCRPENYPPVETTPKPRSPPPYLFPSFLCQSVEIWRGHNNRGGMVKWGFKRGAEVYFFLSVDLTLPLVCQQRFGGQQQQQQ